MERTTNSADARRAADYLSRYCDENGTDVCKGCFAREDSGFCILCESSPNNWELPSIWSAQDIALAKAMMPFAKTIVWPIEAKPNPNHRYFKGEGQRTIPLPTGSFNNLRPGEIINLADIVGGTDDAVLEMIGTAALLEQLAEESAELAQAALKMARKIRNENPTPKSRADCIANLQEEIADVELCISILPAALYDPAEVGRTMAAKHRRWNGRLHDEKLWEVDSHED